MLKKIIIAGMLSSMLASWGYATYTYFTPKVAPQVYQSTLMDEAPKTEKMIMLSFDGPDATVESADGEANILPPTKVKYYCNREHQDCSFVDTQIISVIDATLGYSLLSVVEYVDVATLDVQSAAKRKTEYGFSHFPAFVKLELDENNNYIFSSSIQYESSSPWTVEQLQSWLVEEEVISFE